MDKPDITWIGSPHFSKAIRKLPTTAIVNHIMNGSLIGTDSWFNDPTSKASSHFGVGKNGDIHQYVSLENPAWANGEVIKPSWPLLQDDVNPNYHTVSIEHEGWTGEDMTEKQYQATLLLHRWLISELKLPITRDTIIGHYRINSVTRARCPGVGFPWDRLFKGLEGGNDAMKEAIAYWTLKDFSTAEQIAAKLGNCGMFCRNTNPALHPDAKAAKRLIVVGGPEVKDHPNVTNLCGLHAEDTAIKAAQYAKTL